MKSKALAIHLVLEMAENRANACQVSGHYIQRPGAAS